MLRILQEGGGKSFGGRTKEGDKKNPIGLGIYPARRKETLAGGEEQPHETAIAEPRGGTGALLMGGEGLCKKVHPALSTRTEGRGVSGSRKRIKELLSAG